MFTLIDIVAYIGTILLLISTQMEKRWHLHAVRIIGLLLWIVYGFSIMSLPVLITDAITLAFELVALVRFKRKNEK